MKNLFCAMFLLISISSTGHANNIVYNAYQQPVPILQVVVYQAPTYTVMVPVVVQPQPVIEQRLIWTYPYQPMIVPVNQYYYWGYDKRCKLINKY